MSTVHIVMPPRRVPHSACWYGECTCGATATSVDPDEVRAGLDQCRQAERDRLANTTHTPEES